MSGNASFFANKPRSLGFSAKLANIAHAQRSLPPPPISRQFRRFLPFVGFVGPPKMELILRRSPAATLRPSPSFFRLPPLPNVCLPPPPSLCPPEHINGANDEDGDGEIHLGGKGNSLRRRGRIKEAEGREEGISSFRAFRNRQFGTIFANHLGRLIL